VVTGAMSGILKLGLLNVSVTRHLQSASAPVGLSGPLGDRCVTV
jgi:hypothetical protein